MLVRTVFKTVLASFVATSCAQAVVIGNFRSLQELIDASDAIVILSIRAHVDIQPSPTLYETHDCAISQTLKGDIPQRKKIRLQLMDARSSFVSPFAMHSTHLIFLVKKRSPAEATDYRSIQMEGANIRLSHVGHEKPPEGKNLEEKIRNVVKDSIKHLDRDYERERRFLDTMLAK